MYSEVLQPTTVNQTLTDANTEYSVALPAGCRYFRMQCRTAADVRYAFETGKVATPTAPYNTMKSGTVYQTPEKFMASPGLTLYLAGGGAGLVVEIVTWSKP